MILDEKRHLIEALTRWNYFPNQKQSIGELPPCFNTRRFTPEVLEKILLPREDNARRSLGYDHVSYSSTRHNNVPRTLSLLHPRAYSQLVSCILKNWDEIQVIKTNENSMIKPQMHLDGRIIIMNYEGAIERTHRELSEGFGKKYRVHADIAGCFNNVYTHSISWASMGFENAKIALQIRDYSHWSHDLDSSQRKVKRNETQGIPIGPATSSIIVELVLSKIDNILKDEGFTFRRYIDDYTGFCSTHERAQKFLQILSQELSKFKMSLNLHKTSIIELPLPINDSWVTEINNALPTLYIGENFNRRNILAAEAIQFLDHAVKLNNQTQDGSVLKYAIGSVVHSLSSHAKEYVVPYVLNLCWFYPILLPYLDTLLDQLVLIDERQIAQLNEIIIINAEYKRSDGIAWPAYYLNKHNLSISEKAATAIINSADCISILCLLNSGKHDDKVITFVNDLLHKTDYDKDQYWLLLYQLFFKGIINNPYQDETFSILKFYEVDFMNMSLDKTKSELYCDELNNPFKENRIDFDSFMNQ